MFITAASYRGCGENEEPDHYAARIAFTGNSRVLGPVCIVAGALMTMAGKFFNYIYYVYIFLFFIYIYI